MGRQDATDPRQQQYDADDQLYEVIHSNSYMKLGLVLEGGGMLGLIYRRRAGCDDGAAFHARCSVWHFGGCDFWREPVVATA